MIFLKQLSLLSHIQQSQIKKQPGHDFPGVKMIDKINYLSIVIIADQPIFFLILFPFPRVAGDSRQ